MSISLSLTPNKLLVSSLFHVLTDLYHRLEAATSRLEDMAEDVGGSPRGSGIESTIQQAAVAAGAPELSELSKPSPQPEPEPELLPKSIEAFDTLIDSEVKPFVEISQKFEGPVAEQVSYGEHIHTISSEADARAITVL